MIAIACAIRKDQIRLVGEAKGAVNADSVSIGSVTHPPRSLRLIGPRLAIRDDGMYAGHLEFELVDEDDYQSPEFDIDELVEELT